MNSPMQILISPRGHRTVTVILPPESYEAWLSAETAPLDAKALLRPFEGEMVAYTVDKAVSSPKNDRPELVEEIHVSG